MTTKYHVRITNIWGISITFIFSTMAEAQAAALLARKHGSTVEVLHVECAV